MAVCTRHSDRKTGLSCSACDRPFCYSCLVQGPVGSKCRDCARGIPVGVTPKERTAAKITYAKKNRFLALHVVLAIMAAVDAVILLGTQNNETIRQIFTRDNKYALNAWSLQHGEAWRIVTGSIGNASAITMAINLAAVWWLGRQVVPQLTHLKFVAVSLTAIGGGALATLVIDPNGFNYSGMALSGGLAAAYGVLRRRNLVGRLQTPQFAQVGYIGLFLAWTLLSTLTSEAGGGYGLVGGALAAATLSWWLTDPIRRNHTTSRHTVLGCTLGAALILGAGASAQMTNAAQPAQLPPMLDALGGSDLSPGDAVDMLQAEVDSLKAPSEGTWTSVLYWEDRTDLGDSQAYHVRCDPSPRIAMQPGLATDRDPQAVCAWLKAHVEVRSGDEQITTAPDSALIWHIEIYQSIDGVQDGGAVFEGGTAVATSPLARQVFDALAP